MHISRPRSALDAHRIQSKMSFAKLPHKPTITVEEFKPHVSQEEIDDLHARLAHPPRHRKTWENTNGPEHLGIKLDWLEKALKRWKELDW